MLICIDIGNTNIVVGIVSEDRLIDSFRMETKVLRTEDEYGIRILENLKYMNVNISDIKGVIIASVVPEVDSTFEKTFIKYFHLQPLFVGPGVKTGIKVKIDNPKQLGADLLVGAVAACHKYGCPVMVVDMGTATTITVVNEQKELLGGIIYPGVVTAYNSLVKATSLLEAAKVGVPKSVVGRDTMTSIQSGMIFGTAGAINGLTQRVQEEFGAMKIIVTGGISRHLLPYLENVIYDEYLLIDGLNIIYKKNEESKK